MALSAEQRKLFFQSYACKTATTCIPTIKQNETRTYHFHLTGTDHIHNQQVKPSLKAKYYPRVSCRKKHKKPRYLDLDIQPWNSI